MNEKKKQEIPMDFKLDDFFTSQEQRDDDKKEKVETIDISLIDDFKEHPFKVIENDELKSLEESIQNSGVLSPVIVRPKDDGRYEMISGHRRKFACNKLGIETIPCLVKNLTDDEATIFMVDSNLQREKLLPSEKAFAYKMKYEALKHQGTSLPQDTTLRPVGTKLRSDSILAEEVNESARQIQRYIRLTNLVPELLEMVDNAECGLSPSIAFRPAVELSYLMEDEQRDLVDFIDDEESTPSLAQAIKMKKLSQDGNLDIDTIHEIMEEQKANQITKFKIPEEKLMKVIPKNVDRSNVEDFVIKACEYYSKHLRQRDMGSR